MSPSLAHGGRATNWSFIWLAVVPTIFALAAWIDWLAPYGPWSQSCWMLSLIPMLGLLVVLENALASRSWLVLLPFVPFAAAAIAYPFAMHDLGVLCRYEVDCLARPAVAYGAAVLLPFLAFFGGVVSWIFTPEPSGSTQASRVS